VLERETEWAIRRAASDAVAASSAPETIYWLVELALTETRSAAGRDAADRLAERADAALLTRLIREWAGAASDERRLRVELVIARLGVARVRELLPEVEGRLARAGDPTAADAARVDPLLRREGELSGGSTSAGTPISKATPPPRSRTPSWP
jgi:hypothetical protein